ncbi:Polymerase I and transcript release factor [Fukomys damarensis]|uniref:Polymerase I and transcript release factor n=1 Tax=Fukomys damarensis TaxID=885580 RepID=A0A091DE33_FUKDA|nr:Polymerase I and transcript release factor [Fukomys damarensis]
MPLALGSSPLPEKEPKAPCAPAVPRTVPCDLLPVLPSQMLPARPAFGQPPLTLPHYPEPDEVKLPAKLSVSKSLKDAEALPEGEDAGEGTRPEDEEDAAAPELSSDEAVEVEERSDAGDLLRASSPDVHALLEITEESDAVLVDRSDSD